MATTPLWSVVKGKCFLMAVLKPPAAQTMLLFDAWLSLMCMHKGSF